MNRYRFVTPTRKGPWRDKRAHAVEDAVQAGVAERDENKPERVWFDVLAEIQSEGL